MVLVRQARAGVKQKEGRGATFKEVPYMPPPDSHPPIHGE